MPVTHDHCTAGPVPTAARPLGGLMDAHQIVAGLGGADDILEIASRVEDLLG